MRKRKAPPAHIHTHCLFLPSFLPFVSESVSTGMSAYSGTDFRGFSGQDMTAFCCCVRMGQQQAGNDFAGCKHSLRRYMLNLSALRCKQTAFRMKARNNASLYGKQDTLIETAEAPAPPTSYVLPPTFSFRFHIRKEGRKEGTNNVCESVSKVILLPIQNRSVIFRNHFSFLISHFSFHGTISHFSFPFIKSS